MSSVAVAVAAVPTLPAASVKRHAVGQRAVGKRRDVDAGDVLRGRGHAAAAGDGRAAAAAVDGVVVGRRPPSAPVKVKPVAAAAVALIWLVSAAIV